MYTSYYESLWDITITRRCALQELAAHGITGEDNIKIFLAEVGDKESYTAREVNDWLGY